MFTRLKAAYARLASGEAWLIFLYSARRRGNSLESLAKKLGMPAAVLSQTITNYNELT